MISDHRMRMMIIQCSKSKHSFSSFPGCTYEAMTYRSNEAAGHDSIFAILLHEVWLVARPFLAPDNLNISSGNRFPMNASPAFPLH